MNYESLAIDTPENVLLNAEIAGFASRCVAAMIDYLILISASLCLYLTMLRSAQSDFATSPLFLIVGQFVFMTFYHLILELVWNGQTVGKRALKLRVVQSNGLPATTSALVIRNLVRLFDFLPTFYGVGLVSLFVTEHTQRLGDIAAKTVVIREQSSIELHSVYNDFRVDYRRLSRFVPLPGYIQVDNLTQIDRERIVRLLSRRDTLINPGATLIVMAYYIANRMPLPISTFNFGLPANAEIFLEQTARSFELAEQGEV